MAVFKKGDNWFIDYYVNYRRYRESVGPGTKRDAEKALAKRKVQIKENRIFDKKAICDLTFDQMARDYLAHAREQKRSFRRDEVSCKALAVFFTGKRIRDITPSEVEEYKKMRRGGEINNKRVEVSTVNRELACLKVMFGRLVRDRKYDFNPVHHVQMFNEEHLQRDRVLSDDDFTRLLEAASQPTRDIIETAYRSGMRLGEILNLTWDKVDLKEGFIRLTPEDTKSARQRAIPLDNRLLEVLRRQVRHLQCPYVFHRKGERIRSVKEGFWNACERAGIENLRFHDLRHMAVTRLVKAGLPESAVMMISGHRTREVFKRYVNLTPYDVKAMVQAIPVQKTVANETEAL